MTPAPSNASESRLVARSSGSNRTLPCHPIALRQPPSAASARDQQIGVVIEAKPALLLRQPGRQIAQIGAGAAAEIDQTGRRPERLGEPVGQRAASGGAIVRLAQGQPVMCEPAHAPASIELRRKAAHGIGPARQALALARRAGAKEVAQRSARS